MKYNLSNNREATEASSYLMRLIKAEKIVEVKEIKPRRSLSQNSYLHLLLADFGMFTGLSLEEAKQEYKRINSSIYMYTKMVGSKERPYVRSSADLSVDEMTKSIDKLRDVSAQMGHPLPLATDQGWLREISNRMEEQQRYL